MEVQGRKVNSVDELSQPGDFFIDDVFDGKANFYFRCPCGCNGRHEFSSGTRFELIYIATGEKQQHYWQWDGNAETPTLSPSIWLRIENGGCGWHGFLQNGVWRSV